jgi:putative hydrolase of the HAD superfamily
MTIRAILFDLDNTLYPASSGLMQSIDQRIGEFLQQTLGLSAEESLTLRRSYYAEFGTTLRGLKRHHEGIETEHYLQYVHDIALDAFLASDARLDGLLGMLSVRKVIFTNSPREYAERVLQTLGIAHHFEHIFDLRFFDFACKPEPTCYDRVLAELGIAGHEAMLLEDTAQNLPPAAALGMTTILIDEQQRADAVAHYVVPDVVAAVEIARRLTPPIPAPRRDRRARRSLRSAAPQSHPLRPAVAPSIGTECRG